MRGQLVQASGFSASERTDSGSCEVATCSRVTDSRMARSTGPQGDPHLLQAARRTVVFEVLGAFSTHVCQRAVHGADDVGQRDLRGRACQPVSADRPTLTAHQAGTAQLRQDVLQELARNGLGTCELLGRDGTATDGRKFGSGTECVINPGGKAHAAIMPWNPKRSGQWGGRGAVEECCRSVSSAGSPPGTVRWARLLPAAGKSRRARPHVTLVPSRLPTGRGGAVRSETAPHHDAGEDRDSGCNLFAPLPG